MILVTQHDQVINNMANLQTELKKAPYLADRFGLVHAWYIDNRNPEKPVFGFSKFIGYKDLTAADYLTNSKELDGRNTEWALKNFCEELLPDSPQYIKFLRKLTDWLAEYGKKPRSAVRLMILNSDIEESNETEDKRLFNLMVEVADLLPLDQRHELRARL